MQCNEKMCVSMRVVLFKYSNQVSAQELQYRSYRSYLCPHREYKFDIDFRNKTGRACAYYYMRYQVEKKSRVLEYRDVWLFLNLVREIFKDPYSVPFRHINDPTNRRNYEWISESFYEKVSISMRMYCLGSTFYFQKYFAYRVSVRPLKVISIHTALFILHRYTQRKRKETVNIF